MSQSKIDILNEFCAGEDDIRPYLQRPWSKDGNNYATNGHVIIRVPGYLNIPDAYIQGIPERIEGDAVIDKVVAGKPFRFGELPERTYDDCLFCEGKGTIDRCSSCLGRGELECDLGHDHECPDCEGEGYFSGSDATCDECDGDGWVEKETRLDLGFTGIDLKYAKRIAELPGYQLFVPSDAEESATYFTFDGGDGAVMPVRLRGADESRFTNIKHEVEYIK